MTDNWTAEKQPAQPGDDPRFIKIPGSSRIYDRNKILVVVLIPLMMALLQVSSVNTAIPAMDSALGFSDSQIQWVLSGYALALGICLVPMGRLGDIFGRSGAFVTGLAVFAIGSLLIGLVHDPTTVNLLRLVQGIGAGIFSPQTTGLIQEYFEGRARAKAFAFFGLVVSISVAAGPLMSGTLIEWLGKDIGWRASFILNFPLGLIGMILAFLWLPFSKERRTIGPNADKIEAEYEAQRKAEGRSVFPRSGRQKVDLDPVGMVVLAIAVVSIMLPFMVRDQAWIWVLEALGFALIVLFVKWESSYKKQGHYPMVDLTLFKIRTFSYSTAISAVMFLGTTSIFVVFALLLQEGLKINALMASLVTMPNAVISAYFAIWAGKRAYERGRELQVWALAITLVGVVGYLVTFYAMQNGASYWWMTISAAIMGTGQGIMGSANQTQSMLDVPAAHGGTAGGIVQTSQRITTAIGNAIITAVFFAFVAASQGQVRGYYLGSYAAVALVAVIVLVALILAILFVRDAKKHPREPQQWTATA